MIGYGEPEEGAPVDPILPETNPFLDMVGYQAPEVEPEAPDPRGTGGFGNDLLMAWGSGSNSLLKGLGTMYGLATDNMDNWARRAGERGMEYYAEGDVTTGGKGKSAELRQLELEREMAVLEADGFMEEAGAAFWETIKSPRLLSTLLTQTLPHFAIGGAAGRGLGAVGKLAGATDKAAKAMALTIVDLWCDPDAMAQIEAAHRVG